MYYELQAVDVLFHGSRRAACIAAAGVVDVSEAAQFRAADAVGVTWTVAELDDGRRMLALLLRGAGVLGSVTLQFVAEPTEDLVEALQLAQDGTPVPLAFYMDALKMAAAMRVFRRRPGQAALEKLFAEALFGGDFTVQPDTLPRGGAG